MAKLLSWYASKAMSVNPGFSLMETISGGNDPDFDGVELIKLALVLSGMDRRAFLQSGEIKLGADGFRNLRLHFGTLDLDDAARIEYSRLPKGTSKIVDPTYAALLKIALIDASLPSAPFSKKLDDFMTFLENTLGAIIAVELVTAILFFAGQIRKFIPLRTSAPFQQRLADVRSSAWDIYLARMAPAFIGQGDESNLILPMIVTGDQRLKKILRAQTLAGVVAVEGRPPYPVVGTDFAYLEKFAPRGWDSTSLQKRLANRNRPVQQPIQGNFSPLSPPSKKRQNFVSSRATLLIKFRCYCERLDGGSEAYIAAIVDKLRKQTPLRRLGSDSESTRSRLKRNFSRV